MTDIKTGYNGVFRYYPMNIYRNCIALICI